MDCEVTELLAFPENVHCIYYVVLQHVEDLWLSSNVTVN